MADVACPLTTGRLAEVKIGSPEQVALQIKLKLLENLDRIIAESVKPMENIDSIKIVQVEGLNGGAAAGGVGGANGAGGGNLSDQVVNSALRYRAQAPLVDQLLAEVGLSGADLNGLTGALRTPVEPSGANDAPGAADASPAQASKADVEA